MNIMKYNKNTIESTLRDCIKHVLYHVTVSSTYFKKLPLYWMMKAKQISELHEAQENVYHENKKGFFSIRSKCLKQTKQNVKHTILTLILERSHNENISKPQFFYTAAKYTLKVTLKYSKVKKT